MIRLVPHSLQGYFFSDNVLKEVVGNYRILCSQLRSLYDGENSILHKCRGAQFSRRDMTIDFFDTFPMPDEDVLQGNFGDWVEEDRLPCIQTLRKFPNEELFGKVVMVRFESGIFFEEKLDKSFFSVGSVLFTIKYLYESGAKVVLVSSWNAKVNSKLLSVECFAERLSFALQLKVVPVKFAVRHHLSTVEKENESCIFLLENLYHFKEEVANCSKFAEQLSLGVDIFVNDAFSQSHKILASTVGSVCFCYASVAGFHFEEGLQKLKKAIRTDRKPYFAIIGGGNLLAKAAALRYLASRCDGLVFVGSMAFQIMHARGVHVPEKLLENGAHEEALTIIQLANSRRIPILTPKDFWCVDACVQKQLKLFAADSIVDGWLPVELGPKSLGELNFSLLECKKILWIGPVKFSMPSPIAGSTAKLAKIIHKLRQCNCEIIVVGTTASQALTKEAKHVPEYGVIENASVMWEFLKGRKLPAVMALDRAFPYEIDWKTVYKDISQPLVVDVGSVIRETNDRKWIVSF